MRDFYFWSPHEYINLADDDSRSPDKMAMRKIALVFYSRKNICGSVPVPKTNIKPCHFFLGPIVHHWSCFRNEIKWILLFEERIRAVFGLSTCVGLHKLQRMKRKTKWNRYQNKMKYSWIWFEIPIFFTQFHDTQGWSHRRASMGCRAPPPPPPPQF